MPNNEQFDNPEEVEQSDEVIDLTDEYLAAAISKLNQIIEAAYLEPKGAQSILDWVENMVNVYSREQVSQILYQAEQNQDLDLTKPQIYEELEAIEVTNKMANYIVHDLDFTFSVKPYKPKKKADDIPELNPRYLAQAAEANEGISGNGISDNYDDLELPF